MTAAEKKIVSALEALRWLDLPQAQLNERSALCLLALLDLPPDRNWSEASAPLLGITPLMAWVRAHYGREYAPNTREAFRRFTMHQFVKAGIAVRNPDDPDRAVNSPHNVYQVEGAALALLRALGADEWEEMLTNFLSENSSLVTQYAMDRDQHLVPVQLSANKVLALSPGSHSELIKAIVEDFAPRFAPGSRPLYIGDTGNKLGYLDDALLESLGVRLDRHGKLPDVALYFEEKNWLLLIESVTSHGPVDGKRRAELSEIFSDCAAGLVFVSAFPTRAVMRKYLGDLSWETEVWIADAPSHIIHFNGARFLGPY